ncbi:hypothetical protein Dimus_023176 [Dionaea muscipula]
MAGGGSPLASTLVIDIEHRSGEQRSLGRASKWRAVERFRTAEQLLPCASSGRWASRSLTRAMNLASRGGGRRAAEGGEWRKSAAASTLLSSERLQRLHVGWDGGYKLKLERGGSRSATATPSERRHPAWRAAAPLLASTLIINIENRSGEQRSLGRASKWRAVERFRTAEQLLPCASSGRWASRSLTRAMNLASRGGGRRAAEGGEWRKSATASTLLSSERREYDHEEGPCMREAIGHEAFLD